ncbi:hypothetical protein EBZ37_11355, partial [bacterium]|nr:hypothetical protein [bacterium]
DGDTGTRNGFSGVLEATKNLYRALETQDWAAVGTAISKEWEFRRSLARGITTEVMDQAFQAALQSGATGGKVCGAGGGGCFFLYLPEPSDSPKGAEQRAAIRSKLESLGIRHLPFKAVGRGLEVKVTRA